MQSRLTLRSPVAVCQFNGPTPVGGHGNDSISAPECHMRANAHTGNTTNMIFMRPSKELRVAMCLPEMNFSRCVSPISTGLIGHRRYGRERRGGGLISPRLAGDPLCPYSPRTSTPIGWRRRQFASLRDVSSLHRRRSAVCPYRDFPAATQAWRVPPASDIWRGCRRVPPLPVVPGREARCGRLRRRGSVRPT